MERKLVISTIFFLSILTTALSAAEGPALVWKGSFDGRIMKTSLLQKGIPSKKGQDSFPLHTVMTEKSVYEINSQGKTKKKISLSDYEKAVMSDDGSIIAGLKGGKIILSTLEKEQIGLIDLAGPQPAILPHHLDFTLSPKGEYLLVLSTFTNTLYFYNQKGDLMAKHAFDDLRGAEARFSKEGGYVGVHLPNWGVGKTSGYLLFFDLTGKRLWRFDHQGCRARFDLSNDGRTIALAAEGVLYSLNQEGIVKYEKKMESYEVDLAVSGNGSYIAVADRSNVAVYLLDNRTGQVLWKKSKSEFGHPQSLFTALSLADEGGTVAVIISKYQPELKQNTDSLLFLFDKAGKLLWQHAFKVKYMDSCIAALGDSMIIRADNQVFLYRLPF